LPPAAGIATSGFRSRKSNIDLATPPERFLPALLTLQSVDAEISSKSTGHASLGWAHPGRIHPAVPLHPAGVNVRAFPDGKSAWTTRRATVILRIYPTRKENHASNGFCPVCRRSAPIVAVAHTPRFETMLAGDSSSSFNADCQSDDYAKR
jgi:hypothetical protein